MKTRRHAALMGIVRALRDTARPGAPGIGERFSAIPRLIGAVLRGHYRDLAPGRLGLFALAALYIVSPVDLAPEAFLAVFGLADDAVLGVWLLGNVLDETGRFLAWERGQGAGPGRVVPGEVVDDLR
jgi:hypothetical protein